MDEPGVVRKVWLFAMVLGHLRWLWGRFWAMQSLQTVMRCHVAVFSGMGGAPGEVLYDRIKTPVIGEITDRVFNYDASLVSLLTHYDCAPRAPALWDRTKGKLERPVRHIWQDFFWGRTFRNLDDLNAQFEA